MEVDTAIETLKSYILEEFKKTKVKERPNMVRGHLRALSTEIEDGIAAFLIDILPEGYKAYVDSSVRVGKKTHRPDILIIDENDNVKALVEVKTNMGWCRNATSEIDKILFKHNEMVRKGTITCKFSNDPTVSVNYSSDVPVFLVAFTNDNCGIDKHKKNRNVANANNIKYHCLFSGWYWNLSNLEIQQFANEITRGV